MADEKKTPKRKTTARKNSKSKKDKRSEPKLFKIKRELTPEQKADIGSRGKHFSSEYQPSPEAKSRGLQRAKARNIVLGTIIKEVTENMTEIKIKGEITTVSTLEALVKKLVTLSAKDDKALMRVINMIMEYESRSAVIEQRKEEFNRKNATPEDEGFNDSFIQALNGKAEEIWNDET